jgi:hypothetical protein
MTAEPSSLRKTIESTDRAIWMCHMEKWGLTKEEGQRYADVCIHDKVEDAVEQFCGKRPVLTQAEREYVDSIAAGSTNKKYGWVAEWWPAKQRPNGGWFRFGKFGYAMNWDSIFS